MTFIPTFVFFVVSASFLVGKVDGETCLVQNNQLTEAINKLSETIDKLESSKSHELRNRFYEKSIQAFESLNQIDLLSREVKQLSEALGVLRMKKNVYFSVSTSKKVECYNCQINFEQVHVNTVPESFKNGYFSAPVAGSYHFQFHALVEAGKVAKVQLVFNGNPILHLFDRSVDDRHQKYSMISQSIIYPMEVGDTMSVRLHEGTLKGGGSHAFTSLVGILVGEKGDHPTGLSQANIEI